MVVYYSRGVSFFNNLKFGLNFAFSPSSFCHIRAGPYRAPEERDAGFYDVSLEIILIFLMHYCV